MKFVLRLVLNLILRLALIAVLATLTFGLPAQAEDLDASEVQVGTRLICNTQHEALRFVKLYSGDAEAALKNRERRGKRPNSVRYSPDSLFCRVSSWECED